MMNLEELRLHLLVGRVRLTYIDGMQLYDDFLIHMSQLKKFSFNITTKIRSCQSQVELQTNEDVQRSFIGRGYQQVMSNVLTLSRIWIGQCHIYSLPYAFDCFVELNNSFHRGMFYKVRYLTMQDIISFEYDLFQAVSEDFPFLEYLYITNKHQQKVKQYLSKPMVFPHLTLLHLECAHVDYAEQLLLTRNTHLPCLANLCIKYKSLITITKNFTIDEMEFNFNTVESLDVCESFIRPETFRQYFPLL